jgi:hypothetical protein
MEKISNSSTRFKKGQVPWNKGMPMSEESKKKESMNKIGKSAKYFNRTKKEKMTNILKNRKPNKTEQFVLNIIKENNLPFEYVGNGKYWIEGEKGENGNDELFNPDFLSLDRKKIIEVYSRWHVTVKSNISRDARREEVYKLNGYKWICFWDNELIKKNKGFILEKIRRFINDN